MGGLAGGKGTIINNKSSLGLSVQLIKKFLKQKNTVLQGKKKNFEKKNSPPPPTLEQNPKRLHIFNEVSNWWLNKLNVSESLICLV